MTLTTTETVLLAIIIISVVQHLRTHYRLRHLHKQHNPMATLADLQTAASDNAAASSTLSSAVTAYVAAHSSDITSTDADGVVATLNASTASLTAATGVLNGTPTV